MARLQRLLGSRVREPRTELRLTQTQLAARVGMNYRYIGAIERGEINVTTDSIEKLVSGLGIRPYQLFLFSPLERALDESSVSDERLRSLLQRASPRLRWAVVEVLRSALET